MTSGEDVSYECGYHNQEEEDNSNVSCFFVEVGAVVETSADVKVDADKEEGCAVGVHVSNKSAVVYVSTDVGHGREGGCGVRCVVYCKEKSCNNLGDEAKSK